MTKAIKWFSENHVAANFLMLAVILAGFSTWFKLRKEIFPETSVDAVVISVPYPNATPEDVEEGVIIPIEEAIAEVEGIDRMTSTATENRGAVTVEVETGYDVREIMDDVKTRVDAIDNFAENAERPVLEELVINNQVMSIAVSAQTDEKTLREITERLRDGLLAFEQPKPKGPIESFARLVRGDQKITKITIAGTRPYEISIEVSEASLKQYGLTINDVAQAIRTTSVDLPAGSLKTTSGEVVVRSVGKRYSAADFRNVVVKTQRDGGVVLLSEIADVIDGFEDVNLSSKFNGTSALLLNVFRVGEQDTIVIANMIRAFIEQERSRLPEGVALEIWNDESSYLSGRLDLLGRNAAAGIGLVFLVLALFLRPSLAFLVALGIPASFAGGIWMMPHLDVSINMISLFAFILVLGIVVDDAIVVGENVYTRIRKGEHPKVASWKGTHEVGIVVIFGIITTMVAFTPMLGLSGVSGKIWPNIPLIVIPVLAFSLLQSKFILPAHLALLRPTDPNASVSFLTKIQRKISGGLELFVEKVYNPFLAICLRLRYIVASSFVALLLGVMGLIGGGWIDTQFFPQVEADIVTAKLEMPKGAAFEQTQAAVNRIESASHQLEKEFKDNFGNSVVVNTLTSAGTQPFKTGMEFGIPTASNLGEVTIELQSAKNRTVIADEIRDRWRELVGQIPGVTSLTFTAQSAGGGNALDLNLTGNDLTQLRAATEYIKDNLANYKGFVEIADSDNAGKRELRFRDVNESGRALGLKPADIANQVRRTIFGEEVQRLQRGRDEVKVMVRYPEQDRKSLEMIEELEITTPAGAQVPLLQVVEPDFGYGPDTIKRIDRRRTIGITADVDKSSGANANRLVGRFTEEVLSGLGDKFPDIQWGFDGEQKDQNNSIREMGMGFLFSLIIMYVLMAIPLRSYLQPLIIMSVIPFGIVGAVMGHMIMGRELSIMSMCGIVALAGVVVNDSLVLTDYVNRHRANGDPVLLAARKAGGARFRAIILTSLTTFAGLMPMLFETDIQAKFLIPMAISLGFGILFATLITLILVPSIYIILDDVRSLLLKMVGAKCYKENVEIIPQEVTE